MPSLGPARLVLFSAPRAGQEWLVKNIHEILREKEADCARVQREIEALRLVIPLMEENSLPDSNDRKQPEREEPPSEEAENTGTTGPNFPTLGQSESSFWKRRR